MKDKYSKEYVCVYVDSYESIGFYFFNVFHIFTKYLKPLTVLFNSNQFYHQNHQ
jgi:hypothetical protein